MARDGERKIALQKAVLRTLSAMTEFHFLSKLKDPELLEATRVRVAEEKKATLAVLHHLREVERRRLHLARGFQSLYDFATHELGYSPAAAQRRIDAMRLLREVPELAGKIESGLIGLDSAARAQSVEIRFVAGSELIEKLDRVRELLSHQNPSMSLAELVEQMAKLTVEVLESRKPGARQSVGVKTTSEIPAESGPVGASNPQVTPAPEMHKRNSRYIPRDVQRAVYARDSHQCSYQDPFTGRHCGSRFQLELDHRIPFGRGGENTVENLRVRCRKHNLLTAIRSYGEAKIFQNRKPDRNGNRNAEPTPMTDNT
jgi:5-methylcytosine-specific restriction endonuclease McrA